MTILLATWNDIKVKWLTKGFSCLGLTILSVNQDEIEDAEENGSTCAENALIKVRAIGRKDEAIIIGKIRRCQLMRLTDSPVLKPYAGWKETMMTEV